MEKFKKFLVKQIVDLKKGATFEVLFKKIFIFFKISLIYTIYFILSFLPICLIILLKPFINIRIGEIDSSTFGNFVYCPTHYYLKKRKKFDFIFINTNYSFHNTQLVKMWKRKIDIYPLFLLLPIYKILKIFPFGKSFIIKSLITRYDLDYENKIAQKKVLFFSEKEKNKGLNFLKDQGLNSRDKFICLVVRDDKFQKQKLGSSFDYSRHDYRHTDIEKFEPVLNKLVKKGYFVFRMGKNVRKRLNTNNPKIIDYASDFQNDFLDIFLGANCEFCITTGTGFDDVPLVFNRPQALISTPLGDARSYIHNFIFMTKHHYNFKEKRFLTLNEIFKHKLDRILDTKKFQEKNIILKENTEEEIKDLVFDLIDHIECKPTSDKEINLQKKFYEIVCSHRPDLNKINFSYKISKSFLIKNEWWLS